MTKKPTKQQSNSHILNKHTMTKSVKKTKKSRKAGKMGSELKKAAMNKKAMATKKAIMPERKTTVGKKKATATVTKKRVEVKVKTKKKNEQVNKCSKSDEIFPPCGGNEGNEKDSGIDVDNGACSNSMGRYKDTGKLSML